MIREKKEIKDIKAVKNAAKIYWEAPQFIYYPKSSSWYLGIVILAIILMVIFIWAKQYFSAGIVFLVASVMFIMAKNEPEEIRYQLDINGLSFNNKTYEFNQFKSFWITENDFISTLYLEKIGAFSHPLTIHITKIPASQIREFLRQFLPEKEDQPDSLNESFSKFLRL